MGKRPDNPKIIYEVDPYNRLIIGKTGAKSRLPRFRQVIDGRFRAGKNNTLTYHIKSPTPQGVEVPYQIKFAGNWSLDKEHNLCLSLDKQGRETFGDKLVLQSQIIDVSKNSVTFSLAARKKDDLQSIYALTLNGAWQADKNNRLTFRAQREKGGEDVLTFRGAWEADKRNRIIYRYAKTDLLTKRKKVHELDFKGFWDVRKKGRLSYVLDARSDRNFDFKAGAGIFCEDYIKYELSLGLGAGKKVKRNITLGGKWKIRKNAGLEFAVEYAGRKVNVISFGAEAKVSSRDKITFSLKDEKGKDTGAEVRLSRKLLKEGGEAFLRLMDSKKERAVFIGAGFRW